MGARPILHLGSRVAVVICLGVPRSSWAGRSTRRRFCGRSRAGRIAGALGRSGIFAILCRDNAGRNSGIGTKGRRFFLAACSSVLLGGCRNLLSRMSRRSRLTGCASGRWTLRREHAALFACLSRRFSSRRRKHPAPSKGWPCGRWAFLRCAFLRCAFAGSRRPRLRLSLCRLRIRRCRSRCVPWGRGFCRCPGWRCAAS